MPRTTKRPTPDAAPLLPRCSRPILIAACLAGAVVALARRSADIEAIRPAGVGPVRAAVLAAVVALILLPGGYARFSRLLDLCKRVTPRGRAIVAVLIALMSGVYLYASTVLAGRDLLPKSHDENSYAIQTLMLARGRLWMPRHALADFFDTFQMLSEPVYASIYFPGTAMMFVPGAWLSLPVWVAPLVIASLVVALFFLLGAQLLDVASALVLVLMLLGVQWFRLNATLAMSQVPVMLLGLAMLLAWLRWRQGQQIRWAIALGVAAGWAAITRPVDALAYALPLGVAMLWEGRPLLSRKFALTAGVIVAAATPFLALQLIFDRGVTGRWLMTPHTLYLHRDQPLTTYGFHDVRPDAKPVSTLRQKQIYYFGFMVPAIQEHRLENLHVLAWRRLTRTLHLATPGGLLAILAFAGFCGTRGDLRLKVIAAIPVTFLLLYLPYTFYLWHYVVVVAPPLLILIVLGVRSVAAQFQGGRRAKVAVAGTAFLVAFALGSLPELNRAVQDDMFFSVDNTLVRTAIRQHVKPPAVVLMRYGDKSPSVHDEPVYNHDVAWPDDAPVIRAHDLGPRRNAEIAHYYARTQPHRRFYRFDRSTYHLQHLGSVTELARQLDTAGATTAPSR